MNHYFDLKNQEILIQYKIKQATVAVDQQFLMIIST